MTGKRKQSPAGETRSSSAEDLEDDLELFTRIRPAADKNNDSTDDLADDDDNDTTDSEESEYSGLEEEEGEEDSDESENESASQPSDFDSDGYGSDTLTEDKSDHRTKNISQLANISITDTKVSSLNKPKNSIGDWKDGDQIVKTLDTGKNRQNKVTKIKTKARYMSNRDKPAIDSKTNLKLTENIANENDAEGDNYSSRLCKKDGEDIAKSVEDEEGKEKVDEYADDSSDEEDIRNTVGNVPMEWYRDYEHIGYTVDGKKIKKQPHTDQLDNFLRKMDDPEYWRTVTNKMTGQDIVLSAEDVRLIQRMMSGRLPQGSTDPYEPWVDFFSNEVMIHPVTNRPEDKRSFIPSKWERLRVGQYVDALRKGWMKPTVPDKTDEEIENDEEKSHTFFMLWKDEDEPEITRRHRAHIPAPKLPLPGHEESYNPPPEYLFDEEEEKKWNDADREDRKLNFLPQKFPNLRLVPGYSRFVNERFDRCLDLYLCPRQRKMKMNVNPEDLIPKLPKPRDLQPFPTQQAIVYYGHKGLVRCVTVDPTGQWIASGCDDETVKFWEVSTGRCMKTLNIGASIKGLAWNPNAAVCLVAINSEKQTLLVNANLGDKLVCSATDKMLESYDSAQSSDTSENLLPITWSVCTGADYDNGFRINISHPKEVRQVSWHAKGDYLATVMPLGEAMSVIIHQVSKRRSQNPFRRAKGLVQCVLFHPVRPFLFVATQQFVRVYNLMKQELSKKLMTNCKWVSSMAVHPGGDNVIVGSYDSRLVWFDLDLSTKPYQSLRHHKKAVRQVAYHKRYPLFASASDDCTLIICHGRVYNDLMQNPLIVPVKVLRGHQGAQNLGVLDCVFHPTQPWIFSAGADGTVRLYT